MSVTRVNINPEVLTFARERSGYAIPAIARKMNVKEERWLQWEQGEEKPTTNQLVKLAKYLDRTPGFFYLEKPPKEKDPLSEFRTINNIPLSEASPNLIQAIREAKRNREILLELYDLLNKEPTGILSISKNSIDIIQTAKTVREWLEVSLEEQRSWYSSSKALTRWKEIIENKDIYVIQFPSVDVDEVRGFALAESVLPIIGINSKDSYNARIFTLIHELVHVLLRDSILVNDPLTNYWETSNRTIEQLCNRLAAEILVPLVDLDKEFDTEVSALEEVNRLSRFFGVSDYVILIRLKSQSLISEELFKDLLTFVSFYSKPEGSDGGDPYLNQIVRKGKLFIRNAFQGYFQDQITLAELANITGWKVPNLNKLAAKAFGWPEEGSYV